MFLCRHYTFLMTSIKEFMTSARGCWLCLSRTVLWASVMLGKWKQNDWLQVSHLFNASKKIWQAFSSLLILVFVLACSQKKKKNYQWSCKQDPCESKVQSCLSLSCFFFHRAFVSEKNTCRAQSKKWTLSPAGEVSPFQQNSCYSMSFLICNLLHEGSIIIIIITQLLR